MNSQCSSALLMLVGIVSWAAAAENAERPIELLVRGDDMGHSLDVNLGFIMPKATRLNFLSTLRNLQPGTWYTICHPGLYGPRQAQSVAVLCSQEVKDILHARNIRLISYADLWNRQFGGTTL